MVGVGGWWHTNKAADMLAIFLRSERWGPYLNQEALQVYTAGEIIDLIMVVVNLFPPN